MVLAYSRHAGIGSSHEGPAGVGGLLALAGERGGGGDAHRAGARAALAVKSLRHPIAEIPAALFHLAFALAYLGALGFHLLAAMNHWRDR